MEGHGISEFVSGSGVFHYCLKTKPEDFIVREINLFGEIASIQSVALPKAACPPPSSKTTTRNHRVPSHSFHPPSLSSSEAEELLTKAFGGTFFHTVAAHEELLSSLPLERRKTEPSLHVPIPAELLINRQQRITIHHAIRQCFPLLQTEPWINDTGHHVGVVLRYDSRFDAFISMEALTEEDVLALRRYVRRGNFDPGAREGVVIGVGLGKKDRSAVHQAVHAHFRSLRTSTMSGSSGYGRNSPGVASPESRGIIVSFRHLEKATKGRNAAGSEDGSKSVDFLLESLLKDNPMEERKSDKVVNLNAEEPSSKRQKIPPFKDMEEEGQEMLERMRGGCEHEASANGSERSESGGVASPQSVPGGDAAVAMPQIDGVATEQKNSSEEESGTMTDSAKGAQSMNHLRFVLQKNGLDQFAALRMISDTLDLPVSSVATAGIKDKKAITSQFASVPFRRKSASSLLQLSLRAPQIKVGNFAPSPSPVALGKLKGNRFEIVLRDMRLRAKDSGFAAPPPQGRYTIWPLEGSKAATEGDQNVPHIVDQLRQSARRLLDRGFLNYFGRQRVGKEEVGVPRGVQVGIELWKGDWEKVIQTILKPCPEMDPSAATALEIWVTTRDAKSALAQLPKHCQAERIILKALQRFGFQNPQTVVKAIPNSFMTLFLHAAESWVFNHAVTARCRHYGVDRVVEGDIVAIPQEGTAAARGDVDHFTVDSLDYGRDVIPASANGQDWVFKHVTKADVDSGKYSIYDVVLPSPGPGIMWPDNKVKSIYENFEKMFTRTESDSSGSGLKLRIKGVYRRFIIKPFDFSGELVSEDAKSCYLSVHFSLPPSSYATMCVRELCAAFPSQ